MNARRPLGGVPEALSRVTLRMTSALRLEEVLPSVAEGLVDELGMALARIWLALPDRQCPLCVARGRAGETVALHLVASAGIHTRLDGSYHRVELGALKIGGIAARREPVLSGQLTGDPRVADPAWVETHRLRSFAGYPLLFQGELLGVLGTFATRRLNEEEFAWLGVFAAQAAIAIQNARLFAAAERANLVLRAQNEYLEPEPPPGSPLETLIGASPAMTRLRARVARVAPGGSPVLVLGEPGSGKDQVATAIHQLSGRAGGPLIRVSCAPAPGLEADLLGEPAPRRPGRIELADRGTLVLDEIGELPEALQPTLLRVLEEGLAGRRAVDVRVVAASSMPLEVLATRLRADLLLRLDVLRVEVPPLRERLEDLPALADHFVKRCARRMGKPLAAVDPGCLPRMAAYPWPGNLRELGNVIERACLLAESPIVEVPDPAAGSIPATLSELERAHIDAVLERTGGRIEGPRGAARILGLHPNTLRSRMKKLGLR